MHSTPPVGQPLGILLVQPQAKLLAFAGILQRQLPALLRHEGFPPLCRFLAQGLGFLPGIAQNAAGIFVDVPHSHTALDRQHKQDGDDEAQNGIGFHHGGEQHTLGGMLFLLGQDLKARNRHPRLEYG